tara:strand:- start:3596 stop:3832 length:237 start_codon:yes stop_codon:yes gene_type:complete
MSKLEWMDYPKEVHAECGNKVAWNYYDNEADAKKCSIAAANNALIQSRAGYDFGYCSPSSIELLKKGDNAGLYIVCLP